MKDLSLRAPPSLAIAEGATTPTGAAGAVVWSTTAAKPLYWDGSKWAAFNSVTGFWAAQVATMTSTQSKSTTGLTNVTQLVLSMQANAVYRLHAFVTFQSAATTTGLQLGFTTPSGCSPKLELVVPVTSSAASTQLRKIFPNASETTTGDVLGTGVTATSSNHTAFMSGLVVNGATAGNFQVQFAPETAVAVTLQIGSTLTMQRIA